MILPVAFLTGIKTCVEVLENAKVFFTVSCKLEKRITGEKFHRNIFKKDWNVFMLCRAQAFVKTFLCSFDFWHSLSVSILER